MVRALLARLRAWLARDPEYEGSGDVVLDPAYNGRYAAERELRRLAEEAAAAEESAEEAGGGYEPESKRGRSPGNSP